MAGPPQPIPLKFGVFVKLRGRLGDPSGLMKKLGAIMTAESQESFKKQALGDFRWPRRYPNQHGSPLNVAGAVSDFSKGTWKLPERRFQDRPTLIDTNALRGSMTPGKAIQVRNRYTVEVGTTLPYAGAQQWGGVTVQSITRTTQLSAAKFMLYLRTKSKGKSVSGRGLESIGKVYEKAQAKKKAGDRLAEVESKLSFIFKQSELRTHVNQRPFIGITDQSERRIKAEIEQWFGRTA